MEAVTGFAYHCEDFGIDGCSIPTYAVPLKELARGFAKVATNIGLEASRAKAAKQILEACMNEPFYVASTDCACTKIMRAAPMRVFAKTGAEGVYCAATLEMGLGIALKMDDGAAWG